MMEPVDNKSIDTPIEEELPEWVIPMTWQMSGNITVRARTLTDAINLANSDDSPLPSGEYIDGSFEVTTDDEDYIRNFYNNGQKDLDEEPIEE